MTDVQIEALDMLSDAIAGSILLGCGVPPSRFVVLLADAVGAPRAEVERVCWHLRQVAVNAARRARTCPDPELAQAHRISARCMATLRAILLWRLAREAA